MASENTVFPAQQFHDLLLDGARQSFQLLKRRCPDEHIYRYALVLSASYGTIQPGINTEEALKREIETMSKAAARRNFAATWQDLDNLLRYGCPGSEYLVGPQTFESLLAANALEAEWVTTIMGSPDDLDDLNDLSAAGGDGGAETPGNAQEVDDRELMREVLRALDREGLFGEGAAREQVVLDLHWFEGDTPDAYSHARGLSGSSPPRLNPPAVQERYERALVERSAVRRALFGPRNY